MYKGLSAHRYCTKIAWNLCFLSKPLVKIKLHERMKSFLNHGHCNDPTSQAYDFYQPLSVHGWTSAFLLAVHSLCGVIEGRLSHFLPRWLRTGWQSAISQGKIPWNAPPWLGIEPGPRGGQTVSYPTELSWLTRTKPWSSQWPNIPSVWIEWIFADTLVCKAVYVTNINENIRITLSPIGHA